MTVGPYVMAGANVEDTNFYFRMGLVRSKINMIRSVIHPNTTTENVNHTVASRMANYVTVASRNYVKTFRCAVLVSIWVIAIIITVGFIIFRVVVPGRYAHNNVHSLNITLSADSSSHMTATGRSDKAQPVNGGASSMMTPIIKLVLPYASPILVACKGVLQMVVLPVVTVRNTVTKIVRGVAFYGMVVVILVMVISRRV